MQQLGKYLGSVEEIKGSLKISRTYALVSLDFFKKLKYIRGSRQQSCDENEPSLTILENENLQRLFPIGDDGTTVEIQCTDEADGRVSRGLPSIHYNARLCPQEIEALIRNSKLRNPGDNSPRISYATNGNKANCGSRKLSVTLPMVNSNVVVIEWDNYKQTIKDTWKEANHRVLLGYEIHYRKISEATFRYQNLTKYDGRDACGGDDWHVVDHKPTDTLTEENGTLKWARETSFLSTLNPYSYYALFISTLLLKEYTGSEGVQGAESDIIYFQTLEDIPEPPTSVRVQKTNYSSFNITWSPPEVPNGIIDHYEIILTLMDINATKMMEGPYCKDGRRALDIEEEEEKIPVPAVVQRDNVTIPEGYCTCDTCDAVGPKKLKPVNQKMEEEVYFDAVIDVVFSAVPPRVDSGEGGKRRKRDLPVVSAEDNAISLDVVMAKNKKPEEPPVDKDIETVTDGLERFRIQNRRNKIGDSVSKTHIDGMPYTQYRKLPNGKRIYKTFAARVPGDQRSLFVNELKHYGSYTISVRACQRAINKLGNDAGVDSLSVEQDWKGKDYEKYCSPNVDKIERVLHKHGADDILGEVKTIVQNDTNRVWLSWEPPSDPNELIVNYELELRSKLDSPGSTECVTAKNFMEADNKYRPDRTGSYYVRVRAVSIYGEGKWTENKWITVPGETSTMVMAIVIPIFAVIIIFALLGWGWYYHKSKLEVNGLQVSEFETYQHLEYKPDEWEVEREKVTVGQELGRGAFGLVYKGTYEDPEHGIIQCAIKTVREGANHIECVKFLHEAQTMK